MNHKLRLTLILAAALLGAAAGRAQFTINANDINTGAGFASSYTGTNHTLGGANDGIYDAFDGYGFYQSLPSGISILRQTETFTAANTFRFLDKFTNTTGSTINTTVAFFGNMGSDGAEVRPYNDGTVIVTRDNFSGQSSDPVVALVIGNNAFASTNMNMTFSGDNYTTNITLSLGAGQSISILSYAYLTHPMAGGGFDAVTGGFVANAISTGQSLRNDPILTGLTGAQIANIANFSAIPEPATGALLAGVAGLWWAWRRRRAGRLGA